MQTVWNTIYKILCEIASLKININAYSYDKIDKDTVMIRIIIDLEDQSKPNIYAVKEILKDFNVKFTTAEVLRAIFLNDNVGGYAILLNTINKISTVEYSYVLHDGSAILGVESLKKVMNALKNMVYK
ncbi:MAG TPA: hypothetical protein DG753_01590 [Clostridium sp.]|nr:hypothetical protein [Clostridium sp.]